MKTQFNSWTQSDPFSHKSRGEDIEFKAFPYSQYTQKEEEECISPKTIKPDISNPLPPLPPREVVDRLSLDFRPNTPTPVKHGKKLPDPVALTMLLEAIDNAFQHIPYAVCGLAGLFVWGFTKRIPFHVSIMCPSHSKENIKSWCKAFGGILYPNEPEFIGLPTSDGRVGRVKIKYLSRGFDRLNVVRIPIPMLTNEDDQKSGSSKGAASVRGLSLACLLDQAAQSYIEDMQKSDSHRRRMQIKDNIYWILDRLHTGNPVEDGMEGLTPENVPNVVKEAFWDLFRQTYPDSTVMFRQAGLPISILNKPMVSGCKPTDYMEGYSTQEGPWNGPVFGKSTANRAMTVFTGVTGQPEESLPAALNSIPEKEEVSPTDGEKPRSRPTTKSQKPQRHLTPHFLGANDDETEICPTSEIKRKQSKKEEERRTEGSSHKKTSKKENDAAQRKGRKTNEPPRSNSPFDTAAAARAITHPKGLGKFAGVVREDDD